MPILSKRVVFVVLALCATATLVGVVFSSYFGRKTATKPAVSESTVQASKTDSSLSPDSEIASIKDLIDGEYQFPAVDTSTWKTYRNNEMGFEVKIPQDWEMRNPYIEKGIATYLWFGQKEKFYRFEGGYEDAIVASFSLRTNPHFGYNEGGLISWHNYGAVIKSVNVNGVDFYYHNGYGGEGIDTTAVFPKDYTFSLSSSLILSEYPDVQNVLQGMMQTVKFDGIPGN